MLWNAGGACTRETMTALTSPPCCAFLAAHLLYLINSLKDHKKSLNSFSLNPLPAAAGSSPTCSGKLSPAAWLQEAGASQAQWPLEPTASFHTLKSLPPGVWKLLGYRCLGLPTTSPHGAQWWALALTRLYKSHVLITIIRNREFTANLQVQWSWPVYGCKCRCSSSSAPICSLKGEIIQSQTCSRTYRHRPSEKPCCRRETLHSGSLTMSRSVHKRGIGGGFITDQSGWGRTEQNWTEDHQLGVHRTIPSLC